MSARWMSLAPNFLHEQWCPKMMMMTASASCTLSLGQNGHFRSKKVNLHQFGEFNAPIETVAYLEKKH